MPALASLEELKNTQARIREIQKKHPEASRALAELFKKNRRIGYKNICKMFTGEATPEKLKSGSENPIIEEKDVLSDKWGSHPTADQF